MGIIDKLFGGESEQPGYIDISSLSKEQLKDILADTLEIRDDGKLTEVTEKLYSTLIPISQGEPVSIDALYNTISEQISGIYEYTTHNRIELCKKIDEFVRSNPEVANSIKLIASYVAYGASDVNIEDYKTIIVTGNDNIRQSVIDEIIKFENNSGIKRLIFMLAQDLVKYEDAFLEKIKNVDGKIVGVKYLPSNTILIKLDKKTGKPVKYYQVIDTSISYVDESSIFENELQLKSEQKIIEIDPEDIVHINNGSPIGISDSPLLSLAILWKFLRLLEEALVIHRVTRARRFIIFFLDVTGKTKDKVRMAVSSFTNMLKRVFRIDVSSGSMLSNESIVQSSTDLVIPITKDSATKVQTIPADSSATKIEDLKFYTNRLLTNFMTGWIFYPERTGKEEIQKEAFIRMVKILQKHFSYALTDLYREYLADRGYSPSEVQVRIQFPNPDTQLETKVIDLVVKRMMVVNQITAVLGVVPPIRWIVNYVFRDLSQIEIEELVQLIQAEIKKQEEQTKGQELPSVFEGAGTIDKPNNTTNIFEEIIKLADFYIEDNSIDSSKSDEDIIESGLLEKVSEKMSKSNDGIVSKSRNKKDKIKDLVELRLKATEQSLTYLTHINK